MIRKEIPRLIYMPLLGKILNNMEQLVLHGLGEPAEIFNMGGMGVYHSASGVQHQPNKPL